MSRGSLKTCLAWTELLRAGQAHYSKTLEPLISAGLAARQGKMVTVLDADTLNTIVSSQCREMIRIRDEARKLARSMGIGINIASRPDEALALLEHLHAGREEDSHETHIRDVSARLFHDSKHVERVPMLKAIFSEWSKGRSFRGELRLKAFSQLIHRPQGLDLSAVTRALGQVCIPAAKAARVDEFELAGVDCVLTSENLAPFERMVPGKGLVLFCPGYATDLTGLWLGNLPDDCQWVHFGDFDPDGLAIFERLCLQTGRAGRFVPDLAVLKRIKDALPGWTGARQFDPDRYSLEMVQELAAWGRESNVFAEQEQVLQLLDWEEVCSSDISRVNRTSSRL